MAFTVQLFLVGYCFVIYDSTATEDTAGIRKTIVPQMQISNLAANPSAQEWMSLVQIGCCEHQTLISLTSWGRHCPAQRHIFFLQAGVVWQGLLNLRQ